MHGFSRQQMHMLATLFHDRRYRHLFAAQIIALTGTGLTTVALALLASELAGVNAGLVLGIALALKMVAYVGIAPIVGAYASDCRGVHCWLHWMYRGPWSCSHCRLSAKYGKSTR